MSGRGQTPSQTVGPFFHFALTDRPVDDLDPAGDAGTPIVLEGRLIDGAGDSVPDAMVEVWQPDGAGRFRHPADGRSADVPGSFIGFGRVACTADGHYQLRTVKPGTVQGRGGTIQAPHLNVQIFARGLLDQLSTRVYFEDEAANAHDPVLRTVPKDRRQTLLARADGDDRGTRRYRFDIILQGAGETVFFDV